jgi:hypothetical protein
MAPYSYCVGDRLEERNTYFYASADRGTYDAWRASRDQVLTTSDDGPVEEDPRPATGGLPLPGLGSAVDTRLLLAALAAPAPAHEAARRRAWTAFLVQRFEVSKRVHRAYGPDGRPADTADYRELPLYVALGEVLAREAAEGFLPALNALLKLTDTLVAVRARLGPHERRRLCALIRAERRMVESLARGVTP